MTHERGISLELEGQIVVDNFSEYTVVRASTGGRTWTIVIDVESGGEDQGVRVYDDEETQLLVNFSFWPEGEGRVT